MGQQLQQLHPFYFLRGVEWSYQAVAGSFSRCLDAVQKTQACGAGNAIDKLRQLLVSRKRAVRPRAFRLRSTPDMQDMRNTMILSKLKAQSSKLKARAKLNWLRPELIHSMLSIPNCARHSKNLGCTESQRFCEERVKPEGCNSRQWCRSEKV